MGVFKDDAAEPREPFNRGDPVMTPDGMGKIVLCKTRSGIVRIMYSTELDSPETGGTVVHIAVAR
jgi:ribosomal protein L35AE/L33A